MKNFLLNWLTVLVTVTVGALGGIVVGLAWCATYRPITTAVIVVFVFTGLIASVMD